MKKLFVLFTVLIWGITTQVALADDTSSQCPVGLVNGMTLDDEFGAGTQALTRCIAKRDRVRVVYQINVECKDANCTSPYAIGNINNAIKDYEITHGMKMGDNFRLVAIVHSGGWPLILNNNATNKHARDNRFQAAIEGLIAKGVKVLFCQNTARSKKVSTDQLIAGVGYVTAGVTAIADYQQIGYSYVQP